MISSEAQKNVWTVSKSIFQTTFKMSPWVTICAAGADDHNVGIEDHGSRSQENVVSPDPVLDQGIPVA